MFNTRNREHIYSFEAQGTSQSSQCVVTRLNQVKPSKGITQLGSKNAKSTHTSSVGIMSTLVFRVRNNDTMSTDNSRYTYRPYSFKSEPQIWRVKSGCNRVDGYHLIGNYNLFKESIKCDKQRPGA